MNKRAQIDTIRSIEAAARRLERMSVEEYRARSAKISAFALRFDQAVLSHQNSPNLDYDQRLYFG